MITKITQQHVSPEIVDLKSRILELFEYADGCMDIEIQNEIFDYIEQLFEQINQIQLQMSNKENFFNFQ